MPLIIIGALLVVGSLFLAYATFWAFKNKPLDSTLEFYNWFKKWIIQYRHTALFLLTIVVLASGISMIAAGISSI